MATIFQGDPQKATSYTTSSTETPKWMQDAIYNQIQWATNAAQTPYQPYQLPTVAELSGLQQKAYEGVQQNVGAWQTPYEAARTGLAGMSQSNAGISASTPYALQSQNLLGNINYNAAPSAYQGYLNNALAMNPADAARVALSQAQGFTTAAGYGTTAGQWRTYGSAAVFH